MSHSLAPPSWASFGQLAVPSTSSATNGAMPIMNGVSSDLKTNKPAPVLSPYYSSIGGSAAPFGPNFDLKMLEKGNLLKSCMRHVKRTTRQKRPINGRRSSRELTNSQSDPSLGMARMFGGSRGRDSASFSHYEGTNRLGKLYCRSGYHLQIHNDGKVNGTRQENSRFGILEFLSVAFGLVSIKGKESNKYLCMNRHGRLYGSEKHSEECIFMEKMLENYYNTYTSCKYGRGRNSKKKWYVALNKRGRPKRGNQSKKKHRFTQFLVLHLDDEQYKFTRRKLLFANRDTYFGINSFTQEWRRRQSPKQQIPSIRQHTSYSSVINIPLSTSKTGANGQVFHPRPRIRLRR